MYYNQQVIGTCSLCGGSVCVPAIHWSVVPPTPTCSVCGAVAAPRGPVIDMVPRKRHALLRVPVDSPPAPARLRPFPTARDIRKLPRC